MKSKILLFSLFILLFSAHNSFAQREIRVETEYLFPFDPLGGWYTNNSLSPVATFIESWREQDSKTKLFVVDSLSWGYRHYIDIVDSTLFTRVLDYLGAELITEVDSSQRVSELSDFPRNKAYEEHFNEDIWAIKRYFATPIAKLDSSIKFNPYGGGDFQSLFHTFECDVTGAEISLFAPPRLNASLPKEIYINNITSLLYYDNSLVVVELTGAELKELLETYYSYRYYQIKNHQSDMLKFRTPAYLHIGVGGVQFTLNLTKEKGKKIENWRLKSEQIYRVAMNSFLARNFQISEDMGNYKNLLIEWLQRTENLFKVQELVNIEPQRVVTVIEQRERTTITEL